MSHNTGESEGSEKKVISLRGVLDTFYSLLRVLIALKMLIDLL